MSHSQPLITTDSLSLLDDHEETHWSQIKRESKFASLLQVQPVPPAPEHPGAGREPDREVQLQLRGGCRSCEFKSWGTFLWWSFCYVLNFLLTAPEQTQRGEPPGDSGLSGGAEERFNQRGEAGLSLSPGGECDAFSRGGWCSWWWEVTKYVYWSTSISTSPQTANIVLLLHWDD